MRSTLISTLGWVSAALAASSTGTYTDSATGIGFQGYASGTGFQFGLALPESPDADMIVQIVTPVTNGGGWGGIDFGASMTGKLLIVAWPNGDQVQISPRIATGYSIKTGAELYQSKPVTLTPISTGTFVNESHVSATFLCGGCINADSFDPAENDQIFSYGYTSEPVSEPDNVDSLLSDHTMTGDPYGAFKFPIGDARSKDYDTWVKMAGDNGGDEGGDGGDGGDGGNGGDSGGDGGDKPSGGDNNNNNNNNSNNNNNNNNNNSPGSGSGGSGSSGSSGSGTYTEEDTEGLLLYTAAEFWVLMGVVALLYMAQVVL